MKHTNILLLFIITLIFACKPGEKAELKIDGYSYEVLGNGTGAKVKKGDIVSFDIDIFGSDGSVLQSRNDFRMRPTIEIPVGEVKGPSNPVQSLMAISTVGDSISMIMPKDSLPNVPPTMKDITHLKYVMVIRDAVEKSVIEAEQKAKLEASLVREKEVAALVQTTIAEYKSGKSKVEKLDSGLEYIIHEEGQGALPEVGKNVKVNYYGALLSDGSMFDNSFKRGNSFEFPLGQGRVIKGWDEGIAKLKKGTRATLIIPFELGYGKAGSPPNIPGESTLVFYVEVLD